MTYINFITGLIIAAVLSVPGAMQHEATQVEIVDNKLATDLTKPGQIHTNGSYLKPVIKERVTTYFLYEESDHNDTDLLQDIDNWQNLGEEPSPWTCNESSGVLCVVEFEGDEADFETYLASATYSQMSADQIIRAHKLLSP